MTQSVKDLFEAFRDQCITFRIYYNTFDTLFGHDADVDLLARTAVNFFADLNQILHEHLILNICRLTDAADVSGRQNLTVHQINAACSAANIPLNAEAQRCSDAIHRHRARILPARNKLISHLDKAALLDPAALGGHTPEEGHEFLEALQGYCDEVGRAVGIDALDFRYSPGRGDVKDLLTALGRADRLRLAGAR